MSIYASLWEIKVNRDDSWIEGEWVRVFAAGVPAHIGQPSEGYETDDYNFLPPIVTPYDPDGDNPLRAVVIVQEGYQRKEGQQYVDALFTLTGTEYNQMSFQELLAKIHEKIKPNAP